MLDQGFYLAEIQGLRRMPHVRSVTATNSLAQVRRADVNGIVSYFYSHTAAVAAIGRMRRIPVVATGGGEQLLDGMASGATQFASRLAAFHACTALAKRLLATSTEDYERMRDIAIVGRDRIERSFHGVAAVEQASPRHFQYAREPASLVTIAGLDSELNVHRKGVLEAVDLLARFRAQTPSASLTIIGRTTCQAMVAAHARMRGVAEHVRFAGYVTEEDKLALLHRTRFYVQLSEYEGFGIGALEALAHGCQVIHSNVGGLRDTVADYGIILRRDGIAEFDPGSIPPYDVPDWSRFAAHLAQFKVRVRASTILRALGFGFCSSGSA
jgi:glycosyltransferase involved in cell wall biosynthesis